RSRFKVKGSNIHGWGLFVKTPIPKGEMLIEYQGPRPLPSSRQGWVIRKSIADRLMERYTRAGVPGATDGSYVFKLDDTTQVDATMAGNMARFMNHSCSPNAYSKARCDLSPHPPPSHRGPLHFNSAAAPPSPKVGEELQYDYQFALGGEKIACHCGAPNCWGRMN
ncbi:hypothetical protein EMIHUDRAFT_70530, partial [Emiliania huxleyi CCMP1516]|uniref:[histone H3]-lysine(4) N-trimethyltransferase n=2 Tax=Emiliania huxleyi TaxID=2903 RepID=A0A0D3KNP7_EMIH1